MSTDEISQLTIDFAQNKSVIFPAFLLEQDSLSVISHDLAMSRQEYSQLTSQLISDISYLQKLPQTGISIFALGSLARYELSPYSDVDLLIILADDDYSISSESNYPAEENSPVTHETNNSMSADEIVDALLYPLLNAGLKIDYAIRTITEECDLCDDDCTVALASLDHRFLYGDAQLAEHFSEIIIKRWRNTICSRIDALHEHIQLRHDRHGVLSQLLEPDIKNSAGGIRDALCHRAFNIAHISQINAGLPATSENNFEWAYRFLLDVRTILQLLSHKPRDILYAQYGNDIAQLLGLHDRFELLQVLSRASRIITYCLQTSFMQGNALFRHSPAQNTLTRYPLAEGVVSDGFAIYLAKGVLVKDFALALRLSAIATRVNLPFDQSVLLYFQQVDAPTEFTSSMVQDLLELLSYGKRSVRNIETIDQHGLWEKIFPEWQKVRDLPSRSAMHKYTVDKHLLETVHMAESALTSVERPDLLLLACLLHDIGKGKERELIELRDTLRTKTEDSPQSAILHTSSQLDHEKNIEFIEHNAAGNCWFLPTSAGNGNYTSSAADGVPQIIDHSLLGKEIIYTIASRLGFSAEDTYRLQLVVRHHLLLPQAAIHQDISDTHVIAHLAQEINHDPIVLEILDALSVADALATGPGILTEWKSHLMQILVKNISLYLTNHAEHTDKQTADLSSHIQDLGLFNGIVPQAYIQPARYTTDSHSIDSHSIDSHSIDSHSVEWNFDPDQPIEEIVIEPLLRCSVHASGSKSSHLLNHAVNQGDAGTCICESQSGVKRLTLCIPASDLPIILAELTLNSLLIHGAVVEDMIYDSIAVPSVHTTSHTVDLRLVNIIVEPLFGTFPDKTILRQRLINAQRKPHEVLQLFTKRYGKDGSLAYPLETAAPAKLRWLTDHSMPDTALLELRCRDHRGILARICMIFHEHNAQINWGKISISAGIAHGSFFLQFQDDDVNADRSLLCRHMGYQILDIVPQLA